MEIYKFIYATPQNKKNNKLKLWYLKIIKNYERYVTKSTRVYAGKLIILYFYQYLRIQTSLGSLLIFLELN